MAIHINELCMSPTRFTPGRLRGFNKYWWSSHLIGLSSVFWDACSIFCFLLHKHSSGKDISGIFQEKNNALLLSKDAFLFSSLLLGIVVWIISSHLMKVWCSMMFVIFYQCSALRYRINPLHLNALFVLLSVLPLSNMGIPFNAHRLLISHLNC